ncbi:glycoside hydrolase family 2 protein [Schizophyllum commune]
MNDERATVVSTVKAAIFDSELQWTLRSANGSVEVPRAVPSHAHLDLLRARIITEPNLGINAEIYRWVFCYNVINWTYTASLEPLLSSSEVQAADRVLLVFYGIDTVANVSVQWVFDVTDIVQAYTGATSTFGAQAPLATAAPNISLFEVPGYRHYLWKIQSDYGWNWPKFSIDIYKLGQNFSTPPVEDADWVVNVSLAIRSAASFGRRANMTLALSGLEYESELFEVGTIDARTDRRRGAGALQPRRTPTIQPHRRNLTVALDLSTSASVTFTMRTGFRTVQLVQTAYSDEEVAEKGLTPGDQWHFEPRIRTEGMRQLLESAKLTGQSMLRVWGGGTYQPSSSLVAGGVYDFYALCDELGILAWSEFIFSDALYPVSPWFPDTIEPEVRQNVRRVNRHPSNVQWAGGNENEGIALYHKLVDFLYRVTTEETRSGVLSLDPYELKFDNGEEGHIYGNGERYNYDATQAFNYSTFPLSRFVNEFGWHAMPSIYSWEEVLQSPNNSTVVRSRDHHPPARLLDFPSPNAPQGRYEMTAPVELWLPTPSITDPKHNFTQWCRSTQGIIVPDGCILNSGAGRPERNLGALVWQLSDVWHGIFWAAIEYSGRWKPLQYALGNVFEKVAVYAFWDAAAERLEVDVVSDRLEGVRGVAQLTWYDWKGGMLRSEVVELGLGAVNYTTVLEGEGLTDILPDDRAKEDVWLLVNSVALVDGEIVTSENYSTPTSLAHANLVDPEVQLTHEGDLVFTLNAKGSVAPWTWLEYPAGSIGYFADNTTGWPSNGFYLVPEIDRTQRSS